MILDDGTSLEQHHKIINELQFNNTDKISFSIGDLAEEIALYNFTSNNNLFLACGYGTQDHDSIEYLLVNSEPVSLLLAAVFSRLIMGQWQFGK